MVQFFSKPDAYAGPCGDLRCEVVTTRIPGAPGFMRGLRALFVTDVHALPRTTSRDIAALSKRIADLGPDILLLGGDYSDTPEPCKRLFEGLAGLKIQLGTFGVVGNNDREAFPDIEALRRIMAEAGVTLLINQSQILELNGGRLVVAGLDEYKYGTPDAAGLYPDETAPDVYRLLLSHYPRPVSPMPDLMLSGHTHGGQFNLLGLTPYTIGFERLLARDRAPKFISGLHDCGGGRVFVSKGIGASRLQMRVGVRPEIDLLVFD